MYDKLEFVDEYCGVFTVGLLPDEAGGSPPLNQWKALINHGSHYRTSSAGRIGIGAR